jgi:hypothetical protein
MSRRRSRSPQSTAPSGRRSWSRSRSRSRSPVFTRRRSRSRSPSPLGRRRDHENSGHDRECFERGRGREYERGRGGDRRGRESGGVRDGNEMYPRELVRDRDRVEGTGYDRRDRDRSDRDKDWSRRDQRSRRLVHDGHPVNRNRDQERHTGGDPDRKLNVADGTAYTGH